MSLQDIQGKINDYREILSMLEGHDKLQYIVDISKQVEPLDNKYKLDSFKIRGCASSLWVIPMYKDDVLNFMHDADSAITKGYAKIVLDIFNGQNCKDIVSAKEIIKDLGIIELLTMQRQNGLGSLLDTIQNYAEKG
jgi:cysteine desulfuration protein SufE